MKIFLAALFLAGTAMWAVAPDSVTIGTTGNVPGVIVTGTNQLIVVCHFADGSSGCTDPITYVSSAPQVATVSSTGLLLGVKQGTAKITATVAGAHSSSIQLAVVKLPAGTYSLTITDPSGAVLAGTITIK